MERAGRDKLNAMREPVSVADLSYDDRKSRNGAGESHGRLASYGPERSSSNCSGRMKSAQGSPVNVERQRSRSRFSRIGFVLHRRCAFRASGILRDILRHPTRRIPEGFFSPKKWVRHAHHEFRCSTLRRVALRCSQRVPHIRTRLPYTPVVRNWDLIGAHHPPWLLRTAENCSGSS